MVNKTAQLERSVLSMEETNRRRKNIRCSVKELIKNIREKIKSNVKQLMKLYPRA